MGIVLLIIVIGVVCFFIGKKAGAKNKVVVQQPPTPIQPVFTEQPINEAMETTIEEPQEKTKVIRTINGVDYDLTEVVEILKEDTYSSYNASQKKFEEITGMRTYTIGKSDSQAQIEAAKIWDELYKPYKVDVRKTQIIDSLKNNNGPSLRQIEEERLRVEKERLRLEQQKQKSKKPDIPWFAVGVAFHRASEAAAAKKKRDRELQKAIDKINKMK